MEKIGRTTIPESVADLTFKNFVDAEEAELLLLPGEKNDHPEGYWNVWRLGDDEFTIYDRDSGIEIEAEVGGIVPPEDIIYRIENSVSRFNRSWPSKSNEDLRDRPL